MTTEPPARETACSTEAMVRRSVPVLTTYDMPGPAAGAGEGAGPPPCSAVAVPGRRPSEATSASPAGSASARHRPDL